MFRLLVCLLAFLSISHSQQNFIQFRDYFDSSAPPLLPSGWSTSANRSGAGDFVLSSSSPRSLPYVALSSNASISQTLTSPPVEFPNCTPVRLEFYTSRSSTHTSGLLVEASVDGGQSFPLLLSDTIRNPGTTGYALTSLALQPVLLHSPGVRFRWRLIGVPGAGTSGTFRLDDVTVYAQLSHDLGVSELIPTTDTSPTDQTVTLAAFIKNVGTLPASEYRVDFFMDQNLDRRPQEQERFSSQTSSFLLPGDSALFRAAMHPIRAGDNHFIALVSFAQDRNPSNDTSRIVVQGRAVPQTFVINEIMYDPSADQNEWLELYHRGTDPIDLVRWKISDRPTASGVNSFTLPNTLVQPRDYVLIAADSTVISRYSSLSTPGQEVHILVLNRPSGFGFNNDGDAVILRDPLGTTIDSVSYLPSWHHPDIIDPKGRSLERINPDLASHDRRNWSTSASHYGGSPGRKNGIFIALIPTSASLSIHPNPFSPDGDGFEDFCIIRYNLPSATPLIRVSVFDARGRLIRYLANTELSGAQGEIVWDGLDESRQRARIGPHIIYLEGIDGDGGTVSTAKAIAVVATKL